MSAIPAPSPASTRPAPPATPPARANATGGEARSIKPRTRAKTPDEIGGWVAPRLRLGDTSIAPPLLTSGVIPFVTVMCSPSSACNLAGDTLTITEGAQQVTVAWHAPLAIVVGIVAGFIAILVAIATAITRAIQGRKDEPTAPAREQLALQADEREFQRIVAKEWPSA